MAQTATTTTTTTATTATTATTTTATITRRVGLLTGGGDCPGLNAVIWAVVRSATTAGIEVFGIEDGFEGLIAGGITRRLTIADIRGIHREGGTILGTTNRGNPFRYPVEVDGVMTEEDYSDDVVRAVKRLGLDGLIVIGGDGTLAIAHELSGKGINCVGVPKTIDNDLGATDATFGFYSAVTTAMEALDKLKTTGESHDRVMILEVMGRHAGWIALHCGLAGGAHVILVPELPYDLQTVLTRIRARWDEERRHYTLIVVAEGAFPAGGVESHITERGAGTVARVGGAGLLLERSLLEAFADTSWSDQRSVPEVRTTVLGHLQRGGSPGAFDRIVSVRFGCKAVELITKGRWNRMVCLRGTQIQSVPMADGIAQPHLIDPLGQMVQQARSVGTCMGDR